MNLKRLKVLPIFLIVAFSGLQLSLADTINCQDSFAPRFLCETYADITNSFSIASIIKLILSILIAALVIFVLFQIAKAVFNWIGKSNDDKARAGAIKSISNAVVGIILTIVLVGAVFVTSILFDTGDVPNPLYGCFPSNIFVANDIDAGTLSLANGVTKNEINGTVVFERKSNTTRNVSQGGEQLTSSVNETYNILHGFFYTSPTKNPTTGTGTVTPTGTIDADQVDFMQNNLYCVDTSTSKEHPTGYVILKRVAVRK